MGLLQAIGAVCLATNLWLAPPIIDGLDVSAYSPQQLWAKSDEYFHDGEYLKSVNILRRVVELDPADIEAYSVAAWLIWSLGDEPAGRRWLEQGLAANPDSWQAAHDLGLHWIQRVGDPFHALPYLVQAANAPGRPDIVPRTLAHGLVAAEQPWYAATLWHEIGAAGEAPPAVAANNRLVAVRAALRSDLQAMGGGVVEGPPLPATSAAVVREHRFDPGENGQPRQREIFVARPGETAVIGRITYEHRHHGGFGSWRWLTIAADPLGREYFPDSVVLHDEDGDGIAESLPPLATLREFRTRYDGLLRRLAAPDRYELETGPDGQPAPSLPTNVGNSVRFASPLYLACEEGTLSLRAVARETEHLSLHVARTRPLVHGVYVANSSVGPGAPLDLAPGDLPPGRYIVALEVLREGVVVDRKERAEWVIDVTRERVSVAESRDDDADAWQRAPEVPEYSGDQRGPAAPPPADHQHT